MPTTLTSKGQVTIPKHIRDELKLKPGAALEWGVNAATGEVVLRRTQPVPRGHRPDRFDKVRGSAEVKWRTDELMKLLRPDD